MRYLAEKICRVCSQKFIPTGTTQWRCEACTSQGLRPEKPPLCACGCGLLVTWAKRHSGWNEFVHGHHVRVPGHHPRKKGSVAWNKGRREYDCCCRQCGRVFQSSVNQKFCNTECQAKHRTGKQHPGWKGGDRFRRKLYARLRDDHTCQVPGCGLRAMGAGMHTHHIIPEIIGGSNDLENLITLCKSHHKKLEAALLIYLIQAHPVTVAEAVKTIYPTRRVVTPEQLDRWERASLGRHSRKDLLKLMEDSFAVQPVT